MRRWLVGVLFLLSGATALCYQVAWTRHLVLLFGNTSHAMALILAAYMLGLALGSEVGGRMADRVRRPAVLYAWLEAGIGAFALAFPWLVEGVRAGYLALGTAAPPVLFAGAFVLLVVPTFLMGTTLPLLVRATVERAEWTGGTVGWLYGINIVGAVFGAAVTGFWLLEAAGILGATYWSAAVNGLIGLLGLLFLRSALNPALEEGVEEAEPRAAAGAGRPAQAKAALVAVFAAGFVGLAAEVVWTRLLIFFLQGFTYTFSAMLAMFLAGLAAGGFVFGRVARTTEQPAIVLGRLQIAVGVSAAGVLLLLSHFLHVGLSMFELAGDLTGQTDLRTHHIVSLLLSSALVLFPPAFLMGGVFPLAAAAYQRGLGDLGSRIGRLYAVNTIGAVLGALGAGFVLTPLVGAPWAAALVAIVSVAAGVAVLWLGREGARLRWGWPAVGGLAAVALLVAANPSYPFILRSHTFGGSRARENLLTRTLQGLVCQVSVVENERDDYTLLYTDEFQAAGTKPEYRYMRMLAHLPLALARDPEDVLVICFGTGTTSGSVSTHSTVKRLDIVEISPEVLAVADAFSDVNRDVLNGAGRDDLDVRVHVDDGRNFVLRSRDQWDVITLEPLMPYTPAAIHLYTEDFYRECAPRLAPGGLMCQWIPLHGMSGDHFLRLVRSFVNVFPDSAVFFADGAVALVGGLEPLAELPYGRVAERLADAAVRADLARAGYDDPVRALGTFVAGGERLAEYVAAVEPITDEHPVLEFHPIPSNTVVKHLYENLRHMRVLRAANERLPVRVDGVADAESVEDRLRLALLVGNYLHDGMVRLEEATLLVRLGRDADAGVSFGSARDLYALAHEMDPGDPAARRNHEGVEREWHVIRAKNALEDDEVETAEWHALNALEHPSLRQDDYAWTLLATTRNRLERFEDGLAAAIEATRRFPRGREALAERAYARAALGDIAGARRDYSRALEKGTSAGLGARLANDADRILDDRSELEPGGDPAERIENALAGRTQNRVPTGLALRLLALEHPDAFADRFEQDLARAGDATAAPLDRALLFEQLRLAAPAGAVAVARATLAAGTDPAPVLDAAARLLAELDRASFAELLGVDAAPASLAALARAAGSAADRRVVDALAALLDHDDAAVRRPAQTSLFALVGAAAPGLATLDPEQFGSKRYATTIALIRSWWVRHRGDFRFRG